MRRIGRRLCMSVPLTYRMHFPPLSWHCSDAGCNHWMNFHVARLGGGPRRASLDSGARFSRLVVIACCEGSMMLLLVVVFVLGLPKCATTIIFAALVSGASA
mmetsp:Transcript_10059/g.14353  ORF Transcript_10059/g.14353 Transcript_10059/m.14353 type:complete len:102 (-) Transcript_10059:583-888(-)|eukprot:scaffold250370_cov32-Tisochrysis_lutea.AAC.1